MILLFVYLFLALSISFLCSLLEAVLLSVTPSYLNMLEKEGSKAGAKLNHLKNDIDRPIASILSLNTIAHTVGAAGVGAQAQFIWGNEYFALISAILTLLILIFSEIIPKTLGAYYWKKLTSFTAYTLPGLIFIMYPFVLLSKGLTHWFGNNEAEPTFSREEFSAMAEQGAEEGVFEEDESHIFKNLIRFSSLRIKDIMTPRTVVVLFHKNKTVGEVFGEFQELRFSRVPVYGDDEDDIVGYVLKSDLLIQVAKDKQNTLLDEIKRDVLILSENVLLKRLFEKLLESQEHIAVVVDEYGGFAGVVTMEDVVETLLGMEIVDENDAIEDMQKLARKKWRERARELGIVEPKKEAPQSNDKRQEE